MREATRLLSVSRAARTARCVLLAAALCLAAAGCRTNPVTGESEMVFFSTENELALGDDYHPNLVFMYDGEYIDRDLKLYLGTIVRRLQLTGHRRDMRVDFTVLNTSVYNAFAIPGHVYATRGFLARLESEGQFAAVMGHELAHVTCLHTAKQMTHQVLMAVGLAATGQALGDSGGAQTVMLAGQASLALLGLAYSREQERQADRVGTYYLALGGWHPQQAAEMQRLIGSLSTQKETVIDKYLSTHPQTPDRIRAIEAVIMEKSLLQRGLVQGDGVYGERWGRRLADLRRAHQAYAPYDKGMEMLQKDDYAGALSAAEQAIRMRSDQAPLYRLKGDALLGLGQIGEAGAAYGQSLRQDRRYVPANIGLGKVALWQRSFGEAEKQFTVAVQGFPASPIGNYGLGVARYRLAKFQAAIPPLEMAADSLPGTPMARFILGICYEKTNQPGMAYAAYQNAVAAGLAGAERTHAQDRMKVLKATADAQGPP